MNSISHVKKMRNVFGTVGFFECIQEDNMVYGALEGKNGFCIVNTDTKEAELLALFDTEYLSSQRLYHSVIKKDNLLVFIPAKAKHIAVYDLEQFKISYLDSVINKAAGEPSYRNAVSIGDDIYIFGDDKDNILKLNLVTMKTEVVYDLREYIKGHEVPIVGEGFANYEGFTYVPFGCRPSLIKIDNNTRTFSALDIELPFEKIGGMAQDEDNVWIISRENNQNFLVLLNLESGVIQSFELPIHNTNCPYPYWKPVVSEEYIYIFPLLENKAYRFSKSRFEFEEIKEICEIVAVNTGLSQFAIMGIRNNNQIISFILGKNLKWYDYHTDTGKIVENEISLKIRVENYQEKYAKDCTRNSQIIEESRLPLDLFLKTI